MSATHRRLQPPTPTEEDVSAAPWMKFAIQELGKRVGEHDAASEYQTTLYRALAANNPRGPSLLDWNKVDLQLARGATAAVGSVLMDQANPEVKEYLDTVRTDPSLNKKHRSFKLDTVRRTDSGWRMTAWCAAFVNWCLMQADVTHLGYATAASWLRFGMPLAHPVYGCVVIVAPSTDTASTTGHVAFYGGSVGKDLWLLGGNQGRKVSWMRKNSKQARGYRWPAIVGDFRNQATNTAIA